MTEKDKGFVRTDVVDQPGVVGTRWWQDSIDESRAAGVGRRDALRNMLLGGGALSAASAALSTFGLTGCEDKDDSVEFKTEKRTSLDVQKQFGWSFGAPAEALTFDGQATGTWDKTSLTRMPSELAPSQSKHKPYYSPTLFQAPTALPTTKVEVDSPTKPLSEVLRPIHTTNMDTAYRRGKAMARLYEEGSKETMLVVDMPGPEAVAFAAGAASQFDPIFSLDNWPHPRGVVPAHQTLAAAAYYQPNFVKASKSRPANAAAMMVLDRNRLNPYRDENTQFDNRYLAKLPPADKLAAMGIKKVVYVVPGASDTPELDDLNSDFVEYAAKNVKVHMVAASDFRVDSDIPAKDQAKYQEDDDWPPYFYGGDADTGDTGYYGHYESDHSRAKGARSPSNVSKASSYSPSPRTTQVGSSTSSGDSVSKSAAAGSPHSTMGRTAIAVATTGVVLGAAAAYGARARATGTNFRGGSSKGSSRSGSLGRGFGRSGG